MEVGQILLLRHNTFINPPARTRLILSIWFNQFLIGFGVVPCNIFVLEISSIMPWCIQAYRYHHRHTAGICEPGFIGMKFKCERFKIIWKSCAISATSPRGQHHKGGGGATFSQIHLFAITATQVKFVCLTVYIFYDKINKSLRFICFNFFS